MRSMIWLFMAACLGVVTAAHADEPIVPPGDAQPILQIEAGGPRTFVTAVAFSPQGDRLYATGWDKVVHVWSREANGSFTYLPELAFRVPVGAGLYGGLNALALSEDGKFLAVGGIGFARGIGGYKPGYWILPSSGGMSAEAQLDNGLIYVFDTATRKVTLLRGHSGPVSTLAFVRGRPESSPMLVSAAQEYTPSGSVESRLRVWNVASSAEIPKLSGGGPLPLNDFRPTLQAWSTGLQPRQIRVAIGWGDKLFRVWDVASDRVFQHARIDNTLTVLPIAESRAGRILIGGHGEIGEWNANGSLNPSTDFKPIAIPSVQKQNHLVSAATLIPADKTTGHAALALFVVKYGNPQTTALPEYRLLITTVAADIKVVKEIPLNWRAGHRQPAVSASPDGQTVAVAGNERNEIEIYSVAELLKGRDKAQSVLRGDGLLFREAAFVRQADKLGLVFSNKPIVGADLPPDALVFDILARSIQRGIKGWKLAATQTTDWRVENRPDGNIDVRRPGQAAITIPLTSKYVFSCAAVCPPSMHCPVALVAVASHQLGQPRLQLFRADTGEELRRCTSHTERIRAVTFSDDGRMLVSTAEDRVTSVWSLVDIADKLLGKRGRLSGVGVRLRAKDQTLVVVEVPANSLFIKDDVVLSVQRDKEEVPLQSTADFYRFFLDRIPGENVTVAVRRNGKEQEITTRVGQAIEDAKPLFSVFLSNRAGEPGWSWIGWHPLGNFDASDDDAEQRLAWHFNTGEPDAPAKFAVIGEYRADFYQRNLLAQLIDHQGLPPPPAALEPEISSFWLERSNGELWGENYEGDAFVRSRDVHAVAIVDGLSESRIGSVEVRTSLRSPDGEWQAQGQWQSLARRRDGKWSADLSKRAWSRGNYRVEVRLKTNEAEPLELTRVERLQFLLEAPRIEWLREAPSAVVETADLTLDAVIKSQKDTAEVELFVERPGAAAAEAFGAWKIPDDPAEQKTIKTKFKLEPGQNRLTLRASNASAPNDTKEAESSKLVAIVQFNPPNRMTEPPQITIQSIRAVSGDKVSAPLVAEEGIYQTADAALLIEGEVQAKQPLSQFSLRIGKADKHAPDSFRQDKEKQFKFRESFTLEPGPNSILVTAAVKDLAKQKDQAEEHPLKVFYAPKLPRIEQLTLKEPKHIQDVPQEALRKPNRFYAGFHAPETTLEATLTGELQLGYDAQVLVNDAVVPQDQVSINKEDDRAHRLTAPIKLPHGPVRIQLRLTKNFSQTVQESLSAEYLDLPRITKIEGPQELREKPLSLTCVDESALRPLRARISVDGQERPHPFPLKAIEGSAGKWSFTIEDIGLEEGEHAVSIAVENGDGVALVAASHAVAKLTPAPPPPQLTIDSPGNDSRTHRQQLPLQFSVSSKVDTVVTATVVNHRSGLKSSEKPRKVPAGNHEKMLWDLKLQPGLNQIELVAESIGKPVKESVQVTLAPSPITVEIEDIGGQKLSSGSDRIELPAGRALLRGIVRDFDPAQLKAGELSVRVLVNHFKLPTVALEPDADPKLARFKIEVIFNQPRNQIHVDVFHTHKLPSELTPSDDAIVDCEKPEAEQELRLLLVGVTKSDAELGEIKERVRKKLLLAEVISSSPTDKSRETWKSAAFSRIYVEDLLDDRTQQVQTRLRQLVGHVNQRRQNQVQPIVMIYYFGQVVTSDDNFALKMSDNWELETIKRGSLDGRFMEGVLSDLNGAHLIFLDLKQPTGALKSGNFWPKAPHLGVVVANWHGPKNDPNEVRLISTLEKTMPNSPRLRELDLGIRNEYKKYPEQAESMQLLNNLYDLRLTGK